MNLSNSISTQVQAPVIFLGAWEHEPMLRMAAQQAGFGMEYTATVADLLLGIRSGNYPVAIVEPGTPDLDPLEVLECTRSMAAPPMLVFLLPRSTAPAAAAEFVKMGAYHCADDSMSAGEWSQLLQRAAEEVQSRATASDADARTWRSLLVGASPCMQDLARVIELVAKRRCTVLITGETGTGKEMAARAIHMASGRGHLPMVSLNCSAIPEHLLEAELFGHTRGAFTGAVNARAGRFEEAHDSTLFLDEIGDMPIDLQAKLLRVLQERELQKLGNSETVKVNARVIAASNHDLFERVKQGKFRADLFYRLNVVPIHMPPLRERAGDIRLLVRHFVAKVCKIEGIPAKEVFNETLDHLSWYGWPGNVRQLENMVEKAVVMSGARQVLMPGDFAAPVDAPQVDLERSIEHFAVPEGGIDFAQMVMSFERNLVEQALGMTKGNKTLAANLLRLKRTTLVSKLRALRVGR